MANNVNRDQIDNACLTELIHGNIDGDEEISTSLNNLTCDYFTPNEVNQRLPSKNTKNLSVFSLNCRSLSAHWNDVKHLLSELNFPFDFIGFSEIFSIRKNALFALDGYHQLEYATRPENDDGRGGVGLFIKDSFSYIKRHDLSIFIAHVIETIFVEIQLPHKKNIVIGNIYRPNTQPKADINTFCNKLFEIINIINNENKTIILMGDFNIDLLKSDSHNKTAEYVQDIISHGLKPTITKPTRVTEHSATLIDHIYTNLVNSNIHSGIIYTDISDHLGTFSVIKNEGIPQPNRCRLIRIFSDEAIYRFNSLLQHLDFSDVYTCNIASEAYNLFLHRYLEIYDTCFPLKTVRCKPKFTKRQPWLTKGLLVSSNHKNKLLKKKLNNPTATNMNYYKTYCNMFIKISRYAKKLYYTNILNSYQNDIKKSWSILNELIQKAKSKGTLSSCFYINGRLSSNKGEIVEAFNTFFINAGVDAINQIDKQPTTFHRHLPDNCPQTFFMTPVTPEDVIDSARYLKPKTSEGVDNISSKLMKLTIQGIAEPLSHVFNLSFSTGFFPEAMKTAKVVPIFKSGSQHSLDNYRPISILPAFSKLLEKIVYKQIETFLDRNNTFYKFQYGFRKKHTTSHAIIELIKNIAVNNDKRSKDMTIAVFLDLSKAFDTVSHDILLHKLQTYGIRGVANNWFRSYLTDRKQYTEYNSTKSSVSGVRVGVPQGSILGPLLFLLYINDLNNCTAINILSFADDTTAYFSGNTNKNLAKKMNGGLQNIYIWLCENKLRLNIKKTCFMTFLAGNAKVEDINLSINGININQFHDRSETKSIKFLGIHMDNKLTWKPHINYISNKVSHALYSLNKVKHFLPVSALRSLYFALIHSHFNYGIITWGNSRSINRLLLLQKRAMRIIANTRYRAHTDPIFKSLKILKISDIYKLQISLFAFDYKHNKLPMSFTNYYINPRVSAISTRSVTNDVNIYNPRPRTCNSSESVFYMVPVIWNELSPQIKTARSKTAFKYMLKSSMLDQYNDTVICRDTNCFNCRTCIVIYAIPFPFI